MWIVAKKLHPYPLNLKSKVWNQGEENGGYEHYLVFLVKRRINRLWCVFCVWKRGEKLKNRPGKEQAARKSFFFFFFFGLEVSGAFYSPNTNYKATALQGPPPLNGLGSSWSWHPWKDFDFLFLKRYGTWKFNGQIKTYDSGKLVVHRSVR